MDEIKKEKMTFHLLCVAHSVTSHEYPTDAFVLKTMWLSKMLLSLGHTVYVYGVEGSEVECTEFINVVPRTEFDKSYGNRDDGDVNNYRNVDGYAWDSFNKLGFEAIKERMVDPKSDFALVMFGVAHKKLTDRLQAELGMHFIVEAGIGHPGSYAPFRVFESYAWSHWTYGNENQNNPPAFDAVIPHYYYPEYYPYEEEKEGYAVFMGRMIWSKGISVAIDATRSAGIKLVLIGNGDPTKIYEGDMSHVEYVGVKNIYEKVEYLKKAKVVIYPSLYVEPFGQVALEANLCGTPVLASDWGAFTETVKPGINGYRCRTLDDFVWGINNIENIKPANCRKWAIENYHADRVKLMYQEYFEKLLTLRGEGYYTINEDRNDLNWLTKKY